MKKLTSILTAVLLCLSVSSVQADLLSYAQAKKAMIESGLSVGIHIEEPNQVSWPVVFAGGVNGFPAEDLASIASSTKAVTAGLVLSLVDKGYLSLDDTIQDILPEFQGTRSGPATLRQLLSHSAGLPNGYPTPDRNWPRTGTLAALVSAVAANSRPMDPPGDFNYAGVNYDVACRMAEVAVGYPIEQAFQTYVFDALGMDRTFFQLSAPQDTVTPEEVARGENRYISCGGGLASTLGEMAKYYTIMVREGFPLLSPAMFAEMSKKQAQNPKKLNDPYTTGEYGLGVYRDRVGPNGEALTLSHGGATGSMPWADLDSGQIVIMISRQSLNKLKPLALEVQNVLR